ncbi:MULTISPECIES: hypothetical protein [unclassified Paenibacillus]|uniref:hypothetical protein n=1 Tax=unclassified Paenibacillus TaxID=185978 RepID=UPI001AE372CB|nr:MULTISPECIES: hypothetical protein [unclassified Paenibacillus]MBP1153683.1 hypothetical protein [Paenibacillus sp. PvP091]MBP1170932.1 hypothetical protein [Paenibacillus sp. PvR098]MBP2441960.1 hypothetical protein [Paenibacillus sp. PvP052]
MSITKTRRLAGELFCLPPQKITLQQALIPFIGLDAALFEVAFPSGIDVELTLIQVGKNFVKTRQGLQEKTFSFNEPLRIGIFRPRPRKPLTRVVVEIRGLDPSVSRINEGDLVRIGLDFIEITGETFIRPGVNAFYPLNDFVTIESRDPEE